MQNTTHTGRAKSAIAGVSMVALALFSALAYYRGMPVLFFPVLLVAGGIFSYFLAVTKKSVLAAIPVLLSVTALQIFGGIFASVTGAAVFLASLLLTHMTIKQEEKTAAMTGVCAVLGIGLLFGGILYYVKNGGSLALSDLLDRYNGMFLHMKEQASVLVHHFVNSIPEAQLHALLSDGVTKAMAIDAYTGTLTNAISVLQLLLPGLMLFALQAGAYLMITAFRITAKIGGADGMLPSPHWHLFPSKVSCIVFLTVAGIYIFASLFTRTMNPFMTVLLNLLMTVMPVMLFCGFRVMILRLATPGFRGSTIVYLVLFLVGMVMMPAVALQLGTVLLSFYGAQTVLVRHSIDDAMQQP